MKTCGGAYHSIEKIRCTPYGFAHSIRLFPYTSWLCTTFGSSASFHTPLFFYIFFRRLGWFLRCKDWRSSQMFSGEKQWEHKKRHSHHHTVALFFYEVVYFGNIHTKGKWGASPDANKRVSCRPYGSAWLSPPDRKKERPTILGRKRWPKYLGVG